MMKSFATLLPFRPTRSEVLLCLLACAIGVVLRTGSPERLAIDHFDEGVYSAATWFESATGEPYPASHLYAPPMLSGLIRCSTLVFGQAPFAPMVPSLLAGCLTPVVIWLLARTMFGQAAGLVAVFTAAFSDFHILYSRMALTDVLCLCLMIGAVWRGLLGINRNRHRPMIEAGVLCGLAWWTKYTGWLPVAVVASGSAAWWFAEVRRSRSLTRLASLIATMIGTAAAVFLPWILLLQSDGGYSAVAANHRGYLLGTEGWSDRLAEHVIAHMWLDSWLSAVGLAVGFFAAGSRRFFELTLESANDRSPSSARFPPTYIIARVAAAAVVLGLLTPAVGSFAVLACVAAGGISGMFLWPTLPHPTDVSNTAARCSGETAADFRQNRDSESGSGRQAEPAGSVDMTAAPAISPILSLCTAFAWFGGLLATTPLYFPYPRLSLPLLASLWVAASGGVAWWLEANLNVARRDQEVPRRRRFSGMARLILGVVLFLGAVLYADLLPGVGMPFVREDRTELRSAAWRMALDTVSAADAQSDDSAAPYVSPLLQADVTIDEDGVISPLENALPVPPPEIPEYSEPLTQPGEVPFVVLCLGEPALMHHLHSAGIPVKAVARVSQVRALRVPVFLAIGPGSFRGSDFNDDWMSEEARFRLVGEYDFYPSVVTLLNLFRPRWIVRHPHMYEQTVRLYELRTAKTSGDRN